MTNGSDRLDRIERILENVAERQQELAKTQQDLAKSQQELAKTQQDMAARQQYHDDAFERHDATMKSLQDSLAALVRIADSHHRRLDGIDGGQAA